MRRLLRASGWLVAGILAVVAIAWWSARPVAPDAFYAPADSADSRPGALLRQEAFERGVPANALAWRILYSTTRSDGAPAQASAIVMVSRDAPDGPRPVVAWLHGTTGMAPGCAPSLLDNPFPYVPALGQLIRRGWVFVATDYAGLGTPGPHPYLIGEAQARSALDSIRAARQLRGIQAGDRAVLWGHSQGGHAALWSGIAAPDYAPDVRILGVVAIAPASDLQPLVEAAQRTLAGRILSSFALRAYSEAYPDVAFSAYVPAWKRLLARDMTTRCVVGREALFSAAELRLMGGSVFGMPPASGAFGARLAQNTPDRPLPQPLLVAQGLADDLVPPDIQSRFVRRRCSAGQSLEYRAYPGRDHLSIVTPGSPLVPELLRWTRDRFAGTPPPAGCSGIAAS